VAIGAQVPVLQVPVLLPEPFASLTVVFPVGVPMMSAPVFPIQPASNIRRVWLDLSLAHVALLLSDVDTAGPCCVTLKLLIVCGGHGWTHPSHGTPIWMKSNAAVLKAGLPSRAGPLLEMVAGRPVERCAFPVVALVRGYLPRHLIGTQEWIEVDPATCCSRFETGLGDPVSTRAAQAPPTDGSGVSGSPHHWFSTT
jgi:hypothetical protein